VSGGALTAAALVLSVLALAAAAVAVGAARSAGRGSERERQADWCEDGFVEHLREECRHAPATTAAPVPVPPRTTSEGFAAIDGRLQLVREQLAVWPDDEWLQQRCNQLLDERAALARAAATQPRSRVVREAART